MKCIATLLGVLFLALLPVGAVSAAEVQVSMAPAAEALPAVSVPESPGRPVKAGKRQERPEAAAPTSEVVRTAVLLTALSVVPALVICMTPFIRIVVVLSMVRHAFGMPETPPNAVLISLSLLITMLIMAPTISTVKRDALDPFLSSSMSIEDALGRGSAPMRTFMLKQVKDSDIAAVYRIARQPIPGRPEGVGVIQLTSAFMLNELRTAFKIGFVIFLPFLVIDLVVSSLLIALGMIMVPPSTLSLPIKVLMFVLIDGWGLVLGNVAASFR